MDEQQVPKVVIIIEGGVVKRVIANTDVEFVVLDEDLLVNEDVVQIRQLSRVLPAYVHADKIDEAGLYHHRKRFQEDAQRRLRLLTQ
jgi:hypothetical protein